MYPFWHRQEIDKEVLERPVTERTAPRLRRNVALGQAHPVGAVLEHLADVHPPPQGHRVGRESFQTADEVEAGAFVPETLHARNYVRQRGTVVLPDHRLHPERSVHRRILLRRYLNRLVE